MNIIIKLAIRYILSRLKEASTWRGLTLIGTSAGIILSPDQTEAVVAVGLGISGLIGATFPDL